MIKLIGFRGSQNTFHSTNSKKLTDSSALFMSDTILKNEKELFFSLKVAVYFAISYNCWQKIIKSESFDEKTVCLEFYQLEIDKVTYNDLSSISEGKYSSINNDFTFPYFKMKNISEFTINQNTSCDLTIDLSELECLLKDVMGNKFVFFRNISKFQDIGNYNTCVKIEECCEKIVQKNYREILNAIRRISI